jgi:hypothetical protein
MAVREFEDDSGRRWRVWCITPEAIHPVTRAEDYLADCYQLGWLVFETTSGDLKRRLCPFPANWDQRDDGELRELLDKAEPVATRVQKRVSGDRLISSRLAGRKTEGRRRETAPADLTDLTVIRTFRYPGGRFWSVAVVLRPDDGGAPVLRFTAGARSIDLTRWPRDWPDLPDDRLIELLRTAGVRQTTAYTADTPRRRHDDPPA